jgi:hypothetical protein
MSPFSQSVNFFLYCENGISHRGVAEDLSWIWRCVFGRVVSDASEGGLHIQVQAPPKNNIFLGSSTPKVETPWFFETSVITHPKTQHHIQEDLQLQERSCDNFKCSKGWSQGRPARCPQVVLWRFTATFVMFIFIHSLVFSAWSGFIRNQSPVRRPVWLWHAASWASS